MTRPLTRTGGAVGVPLRLAGAGPERPHLHLLGARIDDPVLGDPEPPVEVELNRAVPPRGGWREDLDDEVRRAADPVLADDVEPFRADEAEVRLDPSSVCGNSTPKGAT
jgi:hypothetical protein